MIDGMVAVAHAVSLAILVAPCWGVVVSTKPMHYQWPNSGVGSALSLCVSRFPARRGPHVHKAPVSSTG